MQRFDNTTTWFNESEDLDRMIETDQINMQPKRALWPRILGGVAGTMAVATCALVLIGRRMSPPVVAPKEIPVAQAPEPQPCSTPAVVPVNENDNANANEEVAAKETAPTPKIGKKLAHNAKPAVRPIPASPEVLLGEKLLAKGKTQAALREFQREIAHNPRDTRALKDACTALKGLGRMNDAARVCRHALVLQPDDVETRARLASIYYSGGAYQWAANEWRRVLAARPTDPQARRGLRQAEARL